MTGKKWKRDIVLFKELNLKEDFLNMEDILIMLHQMIIIKVVIYF